MKQHPLQKLVQLHKKKSGYGIYSVCSSNAFVIDASMSFAKEADSFLLIESTSNQVDQYGGYSGMTPKAFVSDIYNYANSLDFETDKIILGGDHLGPNVWQCEPSEIAMKRAAKQIKAYVSAGYTKIHLDTSMACADDQKPLQKKVIAQRAAFLCKVAEETSREFNDSNIVYVIGTEVPVPGGTTDTLKTIVPTSVEDLYETINMTREAFSGLGIEKTWKRVVAVVVQPGVEFSNSNIIEFNPAKSVDLSKAIENFSSLLYEAHSTDYQTAKNLKELVKNHFMILKVGPALTFAFREAIFALAHIEKELYFALNKKNNISDIFSIIDKAMTKNPKYWQKYYSSEHEKLYFERRFGLSDRIRYYWPDKMIQSALSKLLNNLSKEKIPYALLSQYLPEQYKKIRQNELKNHPRSIIRDKIQQVLVDYSEACCAKNNYTFLSAKI
jgi:D-tagatose-1,6-bisphosphate aldolase subunit GatZ/KbaZ